MKLEFFRQIFQNLLLLLHGLLPHLVRTTLKTDRIHDDVSLVHSSGKGINECSARNVSTTHLSWRCCSMAWRSPDPSACNYFPWGYLKSKVFISKPRTIEELTLRIKEKSQQSRRSLLDGCWNIFEKRWQTFERSTYQNIKWHVLSSSLITTVPLQGKTSLYHFVLKRSNFFCRTL
jgi:hypothetical protein